MVYTLCIILVLLFSYVADKKNKRIFLFLTTLVLTLVCGLRGIGTGVDTINYYNFLSYIRQSGIFFGSDIGFSVISYILMGIFDNPNYPLIVFSAITNFLIVYRLWDFRETSSFTTMMLIYVAWHYPYSFNIVRQFLAIAILFWGTRYIERERYTKFCVLTAFAVTIHTSALLGFGILLISFGYKAKKKKYKILGFGTAAVFIFAGIWLFNDNILKYEGYLSVTNNGVHGMILLKMICLMLAILVNRIFINETFSVSKYGKLVPMQKQIPIMYLAGMVLSTLGMWFTFMNRIGFYFIVFEMPFWGQAVRAKKNKTIFVIFVLVMVGYKLITTMIMGEHPDNLFIYHGFWKE